MPSSLPPFDAGRLQGDITLDRLIPAAPAAYTPLPAGLRPELAAALRSRGIDQLYSHQAEAYASVQAGHHLVVVTPTASGKTLCYNLPVLQRLLEDPEKRAIYLFPTKALAQDQLAELAALKRGLPIDLRIDTYDGDTPPGRRTAIRDAGHIVMTNPDMLHTGVLPHHTRWRRLFSSLEFVVIDELHTYRGLFGSQVANVIRRLKRICAFYGSHPTFICASATIANPRELAERLLEEESIDLVDRSGAPRGERRLIFYNPPLVSPELGVRRSSMLEARRVAAPWIRAGIQTIVFCRSRLQVEVMLSYLREDLAPRLDASRRVRGYRAGYLPLHRREIEAGLRAGEITGVVSTNALELGIDIGTLECSVLVGYPGTIASTWQQLGRAGRRSGSVGVFVASSSPLDQFIVRHPEYFLSSDPEEGLVDPNNLLILAGHLQAGLFELPFENGERLGGADVDELLQVFEEDGSATHSAGRWFWSRQAFPAEEVHLRRIAADNVIIIDTSRPRPDVIGEMDQFSTPVFLHEEAIYLHEGAQFHVDRLDWDEKKAYVRPVDVDYYTDALASVSVRVLDTFASGWPEPHPGPPPQAGEGRPFHAGPPQAGEGWRFHADPQQAGEGRPFHAGLPQAGEGWPEPHPGPPPHAGEGMPPHPGPPPHAGEGRPQPHPGPPPLAGEGSLLRHHGEVKITSLASMFKKIRFHTHENIGSGPIHLPEQTLHTTAYWLTLDRDLWNGLGRETLEAGLQGMAHALRHVASLRLMCDPRDLGSVAEVRSVTTLEPTVTIYEVYPGGVGYATRMFDLHHELLDGAASLVRECGCAAGCPSCIGPLHMVQGAKAACLRLLQSHYASALLA